MNTPTESPKVSLGSDREQANLARTRRKLLLGGGAGVPLLMTIASRPAWAGGMCTPSALASANISGQHTFEGCGISAGWWGNNRIKWPAPPTTLFHSVFAGVYYKGVKLYDGKTLGEVFDLPNSDANPANLGMHLIAGYQNALSFPTQGGLPGYPYTAPEVVSAFNVMSNATADQFTALKISLELANDKYDGITDKPE